MTKKECYICLKSKDKNMFDRNKRNCYHCESLDRAIKYGGITLTEVLGFNFNWEELKPCRYGWIIELVRGELSEKLTIEEATNLLKQGSHRIVNQNTIEEVTYGVNGLVEVKWVYRDIDTECIYCGCENPNTLDHIVPKSRGGKDVVTNLAPCCKDCNLDKANMSYESYIEVKDDMNNARMEMGPKHCRFCKMKNRVNASLDYCVECRDFHMFTPDIFRSGHNTLDVYFAKVRGEKIGVGDKRRFIVLYKDNMYAVETRYMKELLSSSVLGYLKEEDVFIVVIKDNYLERVSEGKLNAKRLSLMLEESNKSLTKRKRKKVKDGPKERKVKIYYGKGKVTELKVLEDEEMNSMIRKKDGNLVLKGNGDRFAYSIVTRFITPKGNTFVNGKKLTNKERLKLADEIVAGQKYELVGPGKLKIA